MNIYEITYKAKGLQAHVKIKVRCTLLSISDFIRLNNLTLINIKKILS